jgi:hypothetical protein
LPQGGNPLVQDNTWALRVYAHQQVLPSETKSEYAQSDKSEARINELKYELRKSEKGHELVENAERHNVKFGFLEQEDPSVSPNDAAFYLIEENEVWIEPALSKNQATLALAHELQHAEDKNVHRTLFAKPDSEWETRKEWYLAHEKRAHSAEAIVALQLKLRSDGLQNSGPYQEMMTKQKGIIRTDDILRGVENYTTLHPNGFDNGKAFLVGQDLFFNDFTRSSTYNDKAFRSWVSHPQDRVLHQRAQEVPEREVMGDWWKQRGGMKSASKEMSSPETDYKLSHTLLYTKRDEAGEERDITARVFRSDNQTTTTLVTGLRDGDDVAAMRERIVADVNNELPEPQQGVLYYECYQHSPRVTATELHPSYLDNKRLIPGVPAESSLQAIEHRIGSAVQAVLEQQRKEQQENQVSQKSLTL